MIQEIYYIIIIYFILGGFGFYIINRKKSKDVARKSYIKFGTYFIIINLIFFSITFYKPAFFVLAGIITIAGFIELTSLFVRSDSLGNFWFYVGGLFLYLVAGFAFMMYSTLTKEFLLYCFLILSIFDSFSQISGQIFGKKRILPKISPNKTLEGLLGGAAVALLSSFWLKDLLNESHSGLWVLSLGIIIFAFIGDVAASFYKRRFQVKDYNNLIPGHGGFLDRFDSLIAGGAWSWFGLILLHL